MKTIFFFILLAAGALAQDVFYLPVLNSRGCDTAAIWVISDTMKIDTNFNKVPDKVVSADTSRAIYTRIYSSFAFSYILGHAADTLDTIAVDVDSVTMLQELQCWDGNLKRWLVRGEIAGLDSVGPAVDTVYTMRHRTNGIGMKQMFFSVCDSVRFVAKKAPDTMTADSLVIRKRRLRVEK